MVLGAVGETTQLSLRFRLDLKAVGKSSLAAFAFWFSVVQSNNLMVLLWKGLHPTFLVACFSLSIVLRVRGRHLRQMLGMGLVLSGYLLNVQLNGHVMVETALTGLGVAAFSSLPRQRSPQTLIDTAFGKEINGEARTHRLLIFAVSSGARSGCALADEQRVQ